MLTAEAEALLDQMQTMTDQLRALQVEMLATWRIVLQAQASENPMVDRAATPPVGVALADSDLPDKPTFSVEEAGQIKCLLHS